jgi:hypothetical protein
VEAIGQGTVALEPHLASYTAGQPVTLTAIADTGAVFVDWTGALTSSANPLTITMASNTVVFATFTGDTSPVVIHSVELLTGGGLRFVVTGPDAADDLGGEWTVIHTETPFSGTFQFEDTSPSSGLRFYRAQVP